MITSVNTLWTVLVANIPLQQWLNITTLYKIVEDNYSGFTRDDIASVTDTNNEPTWHRNLRNALQKKRDRNEILYDGNANYRIDTPYIWRMIQEAINKIDHETSYSEIKAYIDNIWPGVNPDTLRTQMGVLTVNNYSRVHNPENQRPRLTNTRSPYDLLFSTSKGRMVRYDPIEHGVWEIFKNKNGEFETHQLTTEVNIKTYTPADIVWFKNVTNTLLGEAYLNIGENSFIVHFPTKHRKNAQTPAMDEIIILYQKVNGIPAFTHLVTPIDNELIEDSINPDYLYGRRVKIIAKTTNDNYIPVDSTLWNRVNFAGITQGNACRIDKIESAGNTDELRLDIWQRFNGKFISGEEKSAYYMSALIDEVEIDNPGMTVKEGKLRLIAHLVKERNGKIVKEKKQQAIKQNTFFCEVCNFSFPSVYNAEFIECHHLTPISAGVERETTLDDLALVCSNCHRMLHKKLEDKFLSILELKQRIISLK